MTTLKSIEENNYAIKLVQSIDGQGLPSYFVVKEKPEGNIESTPTPSYSLASNIFDSWVSKVKKKDK